MLKVVKVLQLAWSLLLLLIFVLASMRDFAFEGRLPGAPFFLAMVAIIYVGAAYLCQYDNRVAWWVAFPIPALFLFIYLPTVFLNLALFVAGHERYLDSPATIFVVLIYALVFVLPALTIYYSLFRKRNVFAKILFDKGGERLPVKKVERLLTLEGLKRLQLGWAVVLLLYYGYYFARILFTTQMHPYYTTMFIGAAVYFAVALKCFSNNRAAWAAALLLPLFPIVWHLVVWGRCEFVRSKAEEMDMVFLTQYYSTVKPVLFFVLPMLFIYYHLFHEREVLAQILFRHKTNAGND